MSTYSTAQTKLQANVQAVRAMVPHLQALTAGLSSSALQAAATQMRTHGRFTMDWGELAGEVPGDVWLDLGGPRLAELAAGGNASLGVGAADLLACAATELARSERLAVAAVQEAAHAALGYRVIRLEGQGWTALEAWRGHEVMLTLIGDGGVAETDNAGLSDASCHTRMTDLHTEMSRRGVAMEITGQDDHGRRQGGVLIAQAAAEGRGSLAAGALTLKGTVSRPRRPEDPAESALSRRRAT